MTERFARRLGLSCGFVVALLMALALARSVEATTITVQSLSPGSSPTSCTLRDAVTAANEDRAVGACVAGSGTDEIVVAVTGTLVLTDVLPTITTNLSILGPGASALTLSRNPGGPEFRFIDIDAAYPVTPVVTLSGFRIMNGSVVGTNGTGGAIVVRDYSSLTVVGMAFENNRAQSGGAIHIRGPLTVANSLFVNNVATNAGGAAFTDYYTVITASRFISNAALGSGSSSAGGGGAVRLNIGPNWVYNSIFARNWVTPTAVGGATFRISSLNDTYIFHCTIVGDDHVTPSSAIYTTNGGGVTVNLVDSIVTSHTIGLHRSGTIIITEDYNLFYGNITNTQGSETWGPVYSGGNSLTAAPGFLNPKADNYRLLGDSPAIDAGIDAGIYSDFDGNTRPLGWRHDIGAFEHAVDFVIQKTVLPVVRRPGGRVNYTLAFTNTGSHAAAGVVITDALPAEIEDVTSGATLAVTVTPGSEYVFSVPGPFLPGDSGTITLSGTLLPDLLPGPITNTATIGSRNWETNTLDNTSAAVVTVIDGQRIDKWATPSGGVLLPGQRITYTVVVSAPAASPLEYITITDAPPPGTLLVADSITGSGVVSVASAIVMTQASIAASGIATLTFGVQVDPALAASTLVTNVAQVRSNMVGIMNTNAVTHEARVPASLVLVVAPPALPADGVATSIVTAHLADAFDRPVPGVAITGRITPGGRGGLSFFAPTNADGRSSATWQASTRSGTATIAVTTGALTACVPVTLVAGAPATVSVKLAPNVLVADGTSTAAVTVTVVDVYSNVVPNVSVGGYVAPASLGSVTAGATNVSGTASGIWTAGTSAGAGVLYIGTGVVTGSAPAHLVAGAATTVSVSAMPGMVMANGISTTQIGLKVTDLFNNPVAGESLTLTASLGQLAQSAGATNADGRFTTTLTAGVEPGWATVVAQNGGGRMGSVNVEVRTANTPGQVLTGTYRTDATRARSGDVLTFTLVVTNIGLSLAPDVILTATVPGGTSLNGAAAIALPDSPAQASGVVTWTGSLAPGARHTLSFSVTIVAGIGWLSSTAAGYDGRAVNFELPVQVDIEPNARAFVPILMTGEG